MTHEEAGEISMIKTQERGKAEQMVKQEERKVLKQAEAGEEVDVEGEIKDRMK